MKTVQEAGAKYTMNSFRSFLEEGSSLSEKWVMGVISASSPDDITRALESLSSYGNKERFEFLRRACGVA